MEQTLKKESPNNILFVDNDSDVSTTLHEIITKQKKESSGTKIFLAKDAKEAMSELGKSKIDLIVLEIVLPVISGYHLITQIRKQHPGIPIFIYSRLKKPQDLAKMAASGASNIFLKALINLEQLMKAIQNIENLKSSDETIVELNEQIKALMDEEGGHIKTLTQCPNCNLIIPPDSHFCNNCGQQIIKKSERKLMQTESKIGPETKQETKQETK